jgi:hypothetical protein
MLQFCYGFVLFSLFFAIFYFPACSLPNERATLFFLRALRAYPNNPLYCGRLQSPMPALSAKNVLNVEKTTPGEHFWPAALASNFSLGLITTRLFG